MDGRNASVSVPYLDINGSLEARINPEANRQQMWDEVYEKYNGKLME